MRVCPLPADDLIPIDFIFFGDRTTFFVQILNRKKVREPPYKIIHDTKHFHNASILKIPPSTKLEHIDPIDIISFRHKGNPNFLYFCIFRFASLTSFIGAYIPLCDKFGSKFVLFDIMLCISNLQTIRF